MKVGSKKHIALYASVIASSLVLVDPIAWSSRSPVPVPQKDAASASDIAKPIAPAEISRTVIATGTLNASVNVEVGSQLSGLIANLAVDFNDVVQKGQLLAQLDDSKYKAEVNAAKAALESAKADEHIVAARLERALTEIRQTEMQRQILEVRVEKATIALDTATREMNRKSALSDRNFAPAADAQRLVSPSGHCTGRPSGSPGRIGKSRERWRSRAFGSNPHQSRTGKNTRDRKTTGGSATGPPLSIWSEQASGRPSTA